MSLELSFQDFLRTNLLPFSEVFAEATNDNVELLLSKFSGIAVGSIKLWVFFRGAPTSRQAQSTKQALCRHAWHLKQR